jgi:hypothetical protein
MMDGALKGLSHMTWAASFPGTCRGTICNCIVSAVRIPRCHIQ